MENTVLLSIDVFKPNQELLKYGVNAARNLGATLLLFDAQYESLVIGTDYSTSATAAMQVIDNRKRLEEAKQKLADLYKALSDEWHFTKAKLVTDSVPQWQGHKSYYLTQEIKENPPNLVLLSVKQNLNLINELFGTPETQIAEAADCPVMLVPQEVHYSELSDINYLLEREKPIDEVIREVKFLKQLADTFDNRSTINLIYYFGDNKELADSELAIKKSMLLQELGYDRLVFLNMSEHDIEKAIHQNVKAYEADLFAFTNRDRSFLERLTNRDNTKRLILEAKIPVLVF